MEPGQGGKLVVTVMVAVLVRASVEPERVTVQVLNVADSLAKESVLKWQTAPEMGHGHRGLPGLHAAPAVGLDSRFGSVPAVTPLPDMEDASVWARTGRRDTAMNTCRVLRMFIGQLGLLGSAAQFLAVEESSHGEERVRMEMNALDAALNSSPVTPFPVRI